LARSGTFSHRFIADGFFIGKPLVILDFALCEFLLPVNTADVYEMLFALKVMKQSPVIYSPLMYLGHTINDQLKRYWVMAGI